ncbi:MAG: hypothetical protein ACI4RO_01715 [Candidatus Scatosoma sp.]
MKKKICILTAFIAAAVTGVGCGRNTTVPENYGYTNTEPIASELYSPQLNEGIAVDGVKEQCYGESFYRLYYNNDPSSDRFLDCWMYYGDQGLYCYVEVKDNCVYFEESRAVYYNSSVELFFQSAESLSISNKTCQYRISCAGTYTKLCGVKSKNLFINSYFDGLCAAQVDGTLNTNTCNGFSAECFIPWYELGVTNPSETEILFYTAYNRVTNANSGNTTRRRTSPVTCFMATPSSWIKTACSDNRSASGKYSEGNFWGTFNGVFRTHFVFDASADDGTENAKLTLTQPSSQGYAYVKDSPVSETETAYFEFTMKNIGGTSSPKIGLMAYFSNNRVTLYAKGPGTTGAGERCGVVQRNDANGSWNWDDAVYTDTSGANFIQEVKMAAYRKGKHLYFFINDVLYFTNDAEEKAVADTLVLHDVTEADCCHFGIYSASATAEIEKYSIQKGAAADEKFASLLQK